MLPKVNRIRKTKNFDRIYKNGKSFTSPYFKLIVLKNKSINNPKFGFVASKKVGNAVERNRAKRVMREIIRQELSSLNDNFEAIIICYNSLLTKGFSELQKVGKEVLEQANLYKGNSN